MIDFLVIYLEKKPMRPDIIREHKEKRG